MKTIQNIAYAFLVLMTLVLIYLCCTRIIGISKDVDLLKGRTVSESVVDHYN